MKDVFEPLAERSQHLYNMFTIGTHSESRKEHSNTAAKGILKLLNSDFEYSSRYARRNHASVFEPSVTKGDQTHVTNAKIGGRHLMRSRHVTLCGPVSDHHHPKPTRTPGRSADPDVSGFAWERCTINLPQADQDSWKVS